jgi:hypothetical protein
MTHIHFCSYLEANWNGVKSSAQNRQTCRSASNTYTSSVDHTSFEIFGKAVESTLINFCVMPAFPILLHCRLESPSPDFSRSHFVRADALSPFLVSKTRRKVLVSFGCNRTVYILLILWCCTVVLLYCCTHGCSDRVLWTQHVLTHSVHNTIH